MASLPGLFVGGRNATLVRVARRGVDASLEAAFFATGVADPVAALRTGLLAARGRFGRAVALGIGGRDVVLRTMHVPVAAPWRLRLIMDYEIAETAGKAGEPLTADFRLLTVPDELAAPATAGQAAAQAAAAGGKGGELPVLLALAKDGALEARIRDHSSRSGLGIRAVLPAPIALFNAYVGLGHATEEKVAVLLDVSEDGCELALEQDGFLLFARSLPAPEGGLTALSDRAVRHQLANAVAASLKFCQTQMKLGTLRAGALRLSGAGAAMPGLLEALKAVLKGVEDARVFDPLDRLDTARLTAEERAKVEGRGPELAIAVGLSLASQHPRCLDLDLLPTPMPARRELRTRTGFLYAAGAVLGIAAALAIGQAFVESGTVKSRGERLLATEDALDARVSDLHALTRKNADDLRTIDAHASRAAPGRATLRLLERLRAATPRRIALTEVVLEPLADETGSRTPSPPPSPGGRGSEGEVAFRIAGEADTSAGDADVQIAALAAALREDPDVTFARAAEAPTKTAPGEPLKFTIGVRMRASPSAPEPAPAPVPEKPGGGP